MRMREDIIPSSSYVKAGENCPGSSGGGVRELVWFRFVAAGFLFLDLFACLFFGLV